MVTTARCNACRGQGGECRNCGGTGTIPITTVTHACHRGSHTRCKGFVNACDCFCHTAITATSTEGATK